MGLLHKLAGLVVEFPDEKEHQGAPKQKGAADTDVVSAIEEIARGLETESKPSFEHTPAAPDGVNPSLTSPTAGQDTAPDAAIKLPVILSIGQVYDKALIKPDAEGFDITRVEQMLANPEIADLPVEIRARSVKMALSSMGKDLRSVLEDAARRDKALDDYQVYLEHRTGQVEEQVTAANAALQKEIEAFAQAKNAIMMQNKTLFEQARNALSSFNVAKEAEEKRLFAIVAPFVSPGENPVIVSGSAPISAAGHKIQDDLKGEKK
jgi:hypothetical protein